jgi:hypothetical protein
MLIRTHRSDPSTDGNLARLGAYSARMAAGDYDAVYEYFAPDFTSHATARVSPGAVGTDIRPHEHTFWKIAKTAFPDMEFRVGSGLERSAGATIAGGHEIAWRGGTPLPGTCCGTDGPGLHGIPRRSGAGKRALSPEADRGRSSRAASRRTAP